jgi:peptidyl-prolyl cis-trans isomerase SurA
MPFWNRSTSLALSFLFLAAAPANAGAEPTPAPAPGKLVERIVAVVNGKPILLSELEETKALFESAAKRDGKPPLSEKEVLDQVINDRLVAQEIEKRGFTANETAVDRAIDGVMQQNGFQSIEDLKRALRTEGMTLEEYRVNVKKQMETSRLVNSVIRPKVQVTDQDVDAALRRSATDTATEWKSDVAMIFKTKPKATRKSTERLRRQIQAGIPFEKVASRETEGPAKSEGGHIGLVSPSDLQPELAKVLGKIKVGELSDVIETKQGFYLLLVTDRKQGATSAPTSFNREKLREDLEKTGIDRNLEVFVRGLREKAHVEIKL